jgi:hypothetical protein
MKAKNWKGVLPRPYLLKGPRGGTNQAADTPGPHARALFDHFLTSTPTRCPPAQIHSFPESPHLNATFLEPVQTKKTKRSANPFDYAAESRKSPEHFAKRLKQEFLGPEYDDDAPTPNTPAGFRACAVETNKKLLSFCFFASWITLSHSQELPTQRAHRDSLELINK